MDAESIRDLKTDVQSRIHDILAVTIDELAETWLEMFSESTTRENLNKLVDHAQSFLNEICDETMTRKDAIQQNIAKLLNEQERLQLLLRCPPLDTQHINSEPLFNRQVLLDRQLQHLRDQIEDRHSQIRALCDREQELCQMLAEAPQGLPLEPLPSASDIESFEFHLAEMEVERDARSKKIAELRDSVLSLCLRMEIELPRDARGTLVREAHPQLSASNVTMLVEFERALQAKRASLKQEVKELQAQLRRLYGRLDMSPRSRKVQLPQRTADLDDTGNITAAIAAEPDADEYPLDSAALAYTSTTVDRLQTEIDRCEKIKRQNIQKFVEKVRVKIVQLWDKTLRSQAERARFKYFTSDFYTEDLLQMHDLELSELERFYEDNSELFARIEEHQTLWERLLAMEAKAKEPGRYKNRGGQLLVEEKERRLISTKIPKILAEIVRLVEEYNEQNPKRPFTIDGRPVEEHIARMHDQRMSSKEQQISARKQTASVSRSGQTPVNASTVQRSILGTTCRTPVSVTRLGATPSGASAVKGASLKRMASVTNINSTSTKKLRIHTATGGSIAGNAGSTPGKPIKRNILSELAVSNGLQNTPASQKKSSILQRSQALTPSNILAQSHRFVRPSAPRSAVKSTATPSHKLTVRPAVVDTLTVGTICRRRSRRRSMNKSGSKREQPRIIVTDADESYALFEERVKTTSRSSVLPSNAINCNGAAGHTPAKVRPVARRRSIRGPSPAAKASATRQRSPSPLSAIASRNVPYFF